MMDVYMVTMRSKRGTVKAVPFMGEDTRQVLYTALELYPDWQIVRVNRDEEWREQSDGATDCDAAAVSCDPAG